MVDLTDLFSDEPQAANDLYEYFYLISPPQSVKEEVRKLKHKLKWQIGLDMYNVNSPAHISLFKVNDTEDWSGSLKQHELLSTIPSFCIKIAGHEVFKHGSRSRSLVLKIADPKPITEMVKLLLPGNTTYASKMNPHITIAKNISVSDFENISYLSEYDLNMEFVCDKITVLKKRIFNPGKYEKHCEIRLGNGIEK